MENRAVELAFENIDVQNSVHMSLAKDIRNY
jgi:arylamine N-acetyltransferase